MRNIGEGKLTLGQKPHSLVYTKLVKVKLVGTDYNKIVNEVSVLIDDENAYEKMSKAVNPYGDGLACGRIVKIL